MGTPQAKISSYFKKLNEDKGESSKRQKTCEVVEQEINVEAQAPLPQSNTCEVNLDQLERDPGKRKPMWEFSPNLREKVRLGYIFHGPYQIRLKEYPMNNNCRRFVPAWYATNSNWLEYSPTTNASYCFLCYLWVDKPNMSHGHDSFTVKGFDNWKKVSGKDCVFANHVCTAQHKSALIFHENLKNQATHIENLIAKQKEEQIRNNRLRLKATIDVIRWLTFQACALRGHDESITSLNRGNFLELLELLASYNDDVERVILKNAPYNSKYTSSDIQKEILSIIANKVRTHIRKEVGDSYFCVLVDESRDESMKEQMAIILRFVDEQGMIRERILDVVHVLDTFSKTLKESLCTQLNHYEFDLGKLRGQGYDGASNMRGGLNGLKTLILKECPYAYYIHCFAHRLQLALVFASREVMPISEFYTKLSSIINVVCASTKRHDQLTMAQEDEIQRLLEEGEIQSGKGQNQIGTLKRPGDTRWGSHFYSMCSLLRMYDATRVVLKVIMEDGHASVTQRGDAFAAYGRLQSFEFVFIIHLMKDILGKTNALSEGLQKKSQDILNAIDLVSSAKGNLEDLRNNGWADFFKEVTDFCTKHNLPMPDMTSPYTSTMYRPRKSDLQVTFGHYYRVDLFTATLDKQLHELNSRFNEQSMELLSLSASLASKEIHVDEICLLAEKYYPADFKEQERIYLRYQLENLNHELKHNARLSGVSSLSSLCKILVETKKREVYYLVDRMVRLILTLPVSTATTERAFSAMKIFKTRLRNKMSEEFLADSLVIYIEKEIAETYDTETLIDEFKDLKGRRAAL